MFNKDFYPTPSDVIERMLIGVDIEDKVILEPSAGKGNIVDYLNANGAREVLACEKDADLAMIVRNKCRLLAMDFLSVQSPDVSHINLIVMNPPFSAEEKHILHAWEIAPPGCHIISLCNDKVISSLDTESKREITRLFSSYGHSDYFGDCFSDAERKTGVDVSCIYLTKPKIEEEDFSEYFSMEEDFEEQQGEGIVTYDFVRDIVGRYVTAVKTFDDILSVSTKMKSLTSHITQHQVNFGAFKADYKETKVYVTKEEYRKQLQKDCWLHLFGLMKMNKYLTKGVREEINKFVEQQTEIPFTMTNVYKMAQMVVGTHGDRMKKVLIEAFDQICGFSWRENCTGGEHWKTNSDYMINRRFIHPWICESVSYGSKYETVHISYRGDEKVEDIIRALCYMTATNYDDIQPLRNFIQNTSGDKAKDYNGVESWAWKGNSMQWGQWYEWGFFRIRGYKKGTMHFEFLDEKIWEQFNKYVSEFRGWRLPGTTNSNKKARKKGTGLEIY